MLYRLTLAFLLILPCSALIGCGGSSADGFTEAASGPPTPAEAAEAEAVMLQVEDEERAYQSQDPSFQKPGRRAR